MAILPIIEKGDPILNNNTKEIDISEITSPKIQKIIKDMNETLDSISDGVGLAAPQVNLPLQIFIVSKKVLNVKEKDNYQNLVCINPKIIKFSKTKKWLDGEGCLSVRWYYGRVLRSTNVTLEYYDEYGQKKIRGAGGILAHVFQHECDHLKGELFIDKAKNVEYIDASNHIHNE